MVRIPVFACLLSAGAALRRKSTSSAQEGMLNDDMAGAAPTSPEKLRYFWDQMVADQATKGYMSKFSTLRRVSDRGFLWSMQNYSLEMRSKTHYKSTHGPGGVAKVHFEWKPNRYTGMFQKADNCVIRIANAAEPSKGTFGIGKTAYNPNMAIKCYRDGKVSEEWTRKPCQWCSDPSGLKKRFSTLEECRAADDMKCCYMDGFINTVYGARKISLESSSSCKTDAWTNPKGEAETSSDANLLTIWEIDGYTKLPEYVRDDSCNFFEVPLSNHCGDRDDISMTLKDTFLNAFRGVTDQPLMLGTSPFAEATQEGVGVETPDFPFALVFKPNPKLRLLGCDFNDFMKQLRNVGQQFKGQMLYEVYAVHDPWYSRPYGQPDIQHIGSMILDDGFYSSMFGDSELFFRHRFMESEFELLRMSNATRMVGWQDYCSPSSPFVKEEGAAWYEPYLP